METLSAIYWDPRVVLAPDDACRDLESGHQGFEYGGVLLVGLVDLAIEGRLTLTV